MSKKKQQGPARDSDSPRDISVLLHISDVITDFLVSQYNANPGRATVRQDIWQDRYNYRPAEALEDIRRLLNNEEPVRPGPRCRWNEPRHREELEP